MRIISKTIDISVQDELLRAIAPLSDFLLLDIETTGLSAENNAVYLIGCVYHQTDGWNLIQWMDSTGNEEKEVLSSFLLFASGYKTLLHYNGDRFDLPFLRKRMAVHGLSDEKIPAGTLDLYKVITPYKRILGLPDYRQQTMEALLGTGRVEDKSGADLIKVYRKFIADPEQDHHGHHDVGLPLVAVHQGLTSRPMSFASGERRPTITPTTTAPEKKNYSSFSSSTGLFRRLCTPQPTTAMSK